MASPCDVKCGTKRNRMLPRVAIVVLLAAALVLPQLTANQFYIHLANLMLLNSIFAVSLGLIAAVGQISLGHAAFVAAGAYVSALAALTFRIPPILGIVLGTAAALDAIILWKMFH